MADLIDRQAAIDAFMTATSDGDKAEWCKWVLTQVSSAQPDTQECEKCIFKPFKQFQPAQPERKKGEWTWNNACPFCGFQPWYERDIHTLSFCPNCGAEMKEG